MLIGVKETPKIAARVHAIEVDGEAVVYAFRAMLGPAGWCDSYGCARPFGIDPWGAVRRTGHTRAWIYGRDVLVELSPDLVTLDWEIDEAELARVEAAIRQRGGA